MVRLEQFWNGLETVPGLSLTLGEWEALLGTDYDLGRSFLRPTDESARSLPCGGDRVGVCFRQVVEHGPDDFVAVCGEYPPECDSMVVGEQDLVVYEVSVRCLAEELARVLDLDARFEAQGHGLWSLGRFPRTAAHSLPVRLAIATSPEELSTALVQLPPEPSILFTPTRDLHDKQVEELARRGQVQLLGLIDLVGSSTDGRRFLADEPARWAALESREDLAVFRREGRVWHLRFKGGSFHVPDEMGLSYIAILLPIPHRELHVNKMRAVALGHERQPTLASADPVFDDKAIRALEKRIRELKELKREASGREQREEVEEELKALKSQRKRATRRDGQTRELNPEVENLRKAASIAVNRAIASIKEEDAELASHLNAFINRGVFFSYAPDSHVPWLTD